MGKGDKTRARAKKLNKRERQSALPHTRKSQRTNVPEILAPTPEQQPRGVYVRAKGPGADPRQVVNLASDMIGELLCAGDITPSQEQAARTFQEVRSKWLAEIGAANFRSCLDIGACGYDDGDGDPASIAAYRAIERRIGRLHVAVLASEVDKPAGHKPHILGQLRSALQAMVDR